MSIGLAFPSSVVRSGFAADKPLPLTRARALETRDWHHCHAPFFANFSEVSQAYTSWQTVASVQIWLPGWLAYGQFYLEAYLEAYVSASGSADWRLSHAGANGIADTVTVNSYALTGDSTVALPTSSLRTRLTVNVQMQSTGGDTLTIRSQHMTWRFQTASG